VREFIRVWGLYILTLDVIEMARQVTLTMGNVYTKFKLKPSITFRS